MIRRMPWIMDISIIKKKLNKTIKIKPQKIDPFNRRKIKKSPFSNDKRSYQPKNHIPR